MRSLPRDFGVNIVCHRGDYPLVKACCASVRAHLGDLPICLFVDGDFSTEDLQRTYGVRVVYPRDIDDAELRQRSYGYGLTKMLVFWHSPFERFLYLDADTVMWGNVLRHVDVTQADFICNEPHEPYTELILKSQYFDYDRVFAHTTAFEWRNRPYFNGGVFIARRGLFSKREYLDLVNLKWSDHSLLLCGDQGILNLLTFRGADQGRLSVATAPLQAVVPVIPRADLERRFRMTARGPAIDPDDEIVIHWAGAKPLTLHREVYGRPMTYYRRRFLHDGDHPMELLGGLFLWWEELRADYRQAMPPRLRANLRQAKRWFANGAFS